MPPTPAERLAALKAKGQVKKPGLLRQVAEFGEKPLWEAPARWGGEFADYLTEGDKGTSLMDSPYERALRKAKEAAAMGSRAIGSTVSSLTSPTSLALTAGTAGLATPELVGANVARGTTMALKGVGAAQAAHGAYKTGRGIYEGNTGEAISGGLETGMGILGARARLPELPKPPFSATPGVLPHSAGFGAIGQSISPTESAGSVVSGRLPPTVSAASNAMREVPPTTTYPPPSPNTLLKGQSSTRPTAYSRMLGAGNPAEAPWGVVPEAPRFTASQFGVADRGAGPLGVVEKGQVTGGPPIGPVSAGMKTRGPGQAAFEALVPERYKAPPSTVDPTGLSMNLRGEAPPTPTPGLPTVTKTGMGPAKGMVTLEQMVEKHGLEEAAARARMTVPELVETLSAKKVGKKAPAPPKSAPKAEPKSTIGSRLKQQLTEETGAVGPGLSEVRTRQAAAGQGNTGAIGTLKKGAEGVLALRNTLLLGGLAGVKSGLGNLGSHPIAAMENPKLAGSLLRSAMNVPEHLKNFKAGWQESANPGLYEGFGKYNIPGRIMGAADYATQKSLQAGGVSAEQAAEIGLTKPNIFSSSKHLNTLLGKALVPFKTVPGNALLEGVSRYQKHPLVWGGALGAGVGAGALTDDPKKLALASAVAGPYSLPFLAGASVKAGAHSLQGVSPIPEWSIVKTLTEPGAPFGMVKNKQGEWTFDPNETPASVWWKGLKGTSKSATGKRRELGPSESGSSAPKRRSLGPEGY